LAILILNENISLSLLTRSLATTNVFSVDLIFGYLDGSVHQVSI